MLSQSCRARFRLALVSTCLFVPSFAWVPSPGWAAEATQTSPSVLEEIIIIGQARPKSLDALQDEVEPVQTFVADSAALISLIPGGALVNNGAVSGQVQFRGLSGERISVTVDGQRFGSGGPNLMDPAMQYAPLPLLQSLEVARSVGSVSDGPGLAGAVNARYKTITFGDNATMQPAGDVTAITRSGDEGVSLGGVLGTSNDQFRFQVLGAYERGENQSFSDGEIAGTFHDRKVVGLGLGYRTPDKMHRVSLDVRRHTTKASGNAPFAMDIEYIDGDFGRFAYRGMFEGFDVELIVGFADIGHGMTNFLSRTPPMMTMAYRRTLADAETLTLSGFVTKPMAAGILKFGFDFEENQHDVLITNPNTSDFFINSLPGIETERLGGFVEWQRTFERGGIEIGMRSDRYDTMASSASTGPAVAAMPAMLAGQFNAEDRTVSHAGLDGVVQAWWEMDENATLRWTLAHKHRAPSYLEQFAWLPTPASGGLADGNTYVGDRSLEPERALIAEFGMDYERARFRIRPTLFFREIDNFIQGVPFDETPGVVDSPVEMVSAMNGDPTPLRFANVDARLWGADLDFNYRFDNAWRLDGGVSYVKAERRDIKDSLYRIAPLRGHVSVTYERDVWFATLEGRLAAEQDQVSLTNSEAKTDGYGLANVYAGWALFEHLMLTGGVSNVFDEAYEDHLAGYNRIAGSDVPLGARLPGPGRSGYVRLSYVF